MPSQKGRKDSNEDECMEEDELDETRGGIRKSNRIVSQNNSSSPSKRLSARRSNVKEPSIETVEDSDENDEKVTRSNEKKKESSSPFKRNGKKLAVDDDDEDDEMDEVEEVKESGGDAERDVEVDEVEDEEEEYVVKDILKHKVDKQGNVKYLIRWEGYSDEDNTWEPEENLNSPELLIEFWKTIPTSKQPRKMQEAAKKLAKLNSPKKVGSKEDSSEISGDLEAAEVDQTLNIDDSDDIAKADEAESIEEDGVEDDQRQKDRENSEKMLEKYGEELTWEYLVKEVETVVRDDDNTLRVSLAFNSGEKFWAQKHIVYEKCPQVMLQFYEEHLRFRSGN